MRRQEIQDVVVMGSLIWELGSWVLVHRGPRSGGAKANQSRLWEFLIAFPFFPDAKKTTKRKKTQRTKSQSKQHDKHHTFFPSLSTRPPCIDLKAHADAMGNEQTLPSIPQERRGDRGPLSEMYEGNQQPLVSSSSSSSLPSPVVVRPLPAPAPALKRTRSALFRRRKAPEPVDPAQLFPNVKKKKKLGDVF